MGHLPRSVPSRSVMTRATDAHRGSHDSEIAQHLVWIVMETWPVHSRTDVMRQPLDERPQPGDELGSTRMARLEAISLDIGGAYEKRST